ncbi:hypothetical protein J2Y45_000747 [Dyadobacter sp. BE34]|nr:hypothetical protein [Dyadobacter sp. BE34]MDR7041218.1 hypothetical protein [Dyadobacter sp. BE242]MDR7195621.1 hypothetical protein [Dyadobacter sp. BE34]MDR7213834.1 hypothetical protein [Dyadobacter sp. BE31]
MAILANGFMVAGILGACQPENNTVPAPQTPETTSDRNAKTAQAVGLLIKDGQVDLSYQGSGVLWKEIYATAYSEFIYAPQLITAKGYKYGIPPAEYKYILDTFGRCVQSVTNKTYIYEYNTNGQLSKWYNKDKPNERLVFSYVTDATGWKKSLGMVTFYDESGTKTKVLKFSYGAPEQVIPDKYPLTPDILPDGISRYLPVFGTFNTYLVKTLTEEKYLLNGQKLSSTQYSYSYALDYAGKVKNVTMKKANGTIVSSTDRKYSVPTYNF